MIEDFQFGIFPAPAHGDYCRCGGNLTSGLCHAARQGRIDRGEIHVATVSAEIGGKVKLSFVWDEIETAIAESERIDAIVSYDYD